MSEPKLTEVVHASMGLATLPLSKAHASACRRGCARPSRATGTGYTGPCEACTTGWEQTESSLKDRGAGTTYQPVRRDLDFGCLSHCCLKRLRGWDASVRPLTRPQRLVHDEGGTRRENDGAFDTFANSRMLPGQ